MPPNSEASSDQKEHLEIDFDGERWQRHRKNISPTGVRAAYHPPGEDPQRGGAVLDFLSVDRPTDVKTLEDALARCNSEFVLKGDLGIGNNGGSACSND